MNLLPPASDRACRRRARFARGMSLLEVIAAVSLIAAVAVAIVPRLVHTSDSTKQTACHLLREQIGIESQLWRRRHGRWPRSIDELASDPVHFPRGAPVCPLTGERYRLDSATHFVRGHVHSP